MSATPTIDAMILSARAARKMRKAKVDVLADGHITPGVVQESVVLIREIGYFDAVEDTLLYMKNNKVTDELLLEVIKGTVV